MKSVCGGGGSFDVTEAYSNAEPAWHLPDSLQPTPYTGPIEGGNQDDKAKEKLHLNPEANGRG